jgi:hypothetical protein
MRSAYLAAATVMAIGAYLALAAAAGFDANAIAIGTVVLAAAGAVAMVVSARTSVAEAR